jgi:hypothetical protein
MPQYTLEQIQSYKPPTKLHPIADKIFRVYESAGDKFTAEGLDEIRAELANYHGDLKELTDALTGLAAFIMLAMEKLNDPVAAEQIAELVKEQRPHYAEIGAMVANALAEAPQNLAEKASAAFKRLTGKEDQKKEAPKYGDAGPPGSIPVATLQKPAAAPPKVSIPPKKPAAKKAKKR